MLVKGSFDVDSRRPYVQGLLFIPRLQKTHRINFLVDTGSDSTILNPKDGKMMRINYDGLRYAEPIYGVGAKTKASVHSAIVAFASDGDSLVLYNIELDIMPNLPDTDILPSQLGTDVLHKWRMYWDSHQDRLEFEVLSFDAVLPKGLFDNSL